MEKDYKKEYTIALLIDSDNLSTDYYDIIISELEELGNIKYKRVYGNFHGNNSWTNYALNKGITPIQAFAPVKGKNATDMVMAIDAMDIFYSDTVDAFCLATSDSDFARLAQRLKEGGMFVVVAGKEQSPDSLNNSCNKFLMLDVLFNMSKNKKTPSKDAKSSTQVKPKAKSVKSTLIKDSARDKINKKKDSVATCENIKISDIRIDENIVEKSSAEPEIAENIVEKPNIDLIKLAIESIINERSHDGWAYYAEVVAQLEKKYPQFNYKMYQAINKQDFFKNKIGCEMKTIGTSMMIKLI